MQALVTAVGGLILGAPLFVGGASGMAFWAGTTDGALLYMPWILGGAGVAIFLWRVGGAHFAPALCAIVVGTLSALRPVLRPIPTGYGDFFSPTSETALTRTLPGLMLVGLGLVLLALHDKKNIRERFVTARPRPLSLVGLVVGAGLGWWGADALAPRYVIQEVPVISTVSESVHLLPLGVSWSGAEGLIDGGGKIKAIFFDDGYHVSIDGVPEGGTWKLGDQSGRTSAYTSIHVPIQDTLGTRTWEDIKKLDPGFSLDLTLTDGRSGTVRLPAIDARYGVTRLLEAVENGPVRFGNEATDAAPRDSLYWTYGTGKFIGNTRTIAELDLILMTHRRTEPSGTRSCPPARAEKTGFTLKLIETEATLYDRRTGDVVARQNFPAEDRCPSIRIPINASEVDSLMPTARIEDWVRPFVGR